MTPSKSDGVVLGVVYGLVAAVTYTLANLALRKVATTGDLDWAVWVSANKALPVTIVAWLIVVWRLWQGLPALPPAPMLLPLVATGIFMQFGGNVLFQIALSYGGLALSVPLTFSTIIISGAILGRMFLAEPIPPRTAFAILLMMMAVFVLSLGADAASAVVAAEPSIRSTILAVLMATGSGIGFGACGVVIRACMNSRYPISGTLAVISTTGLLVLSAMSLARVGLAGLASTPPQDLQWMLVAGVANAVAFFAVTAAYQRLSVITVNLINTSQAAMAGVAGVLLFGEPATVWLLLGVTLTACGLLLTQQGRSPASTSELENSGETPRDPASCLIPVKADEQ